MTTTQPLTHNPNPNTKPTPKDKPKDSGKDKNPPSPLSPAQFSTTQIHLLTQELTSELQETSSLITLSTPTALQRAGVALLNLVVSSQRTGMCGRMVVELVLDSAVAGRGKGGGGGEKGDGAGGELPEHAIRTGDIVSVSEQPAASAKKRDVKKGGGVKGVVTRVGPRGIWVAVESEQGNSNSNSSSSGNSGGDGDEGVDWGKRVWVVRLADEVTFKRMNQTMTRMQKMKEEEYSSFIRVMFGLTSPSPVEEVAEPKWIDPTLNDSQKDAIRFALGSREMALIHGPPGTGKTHTLIELILQMLAQNLRVLVCGPSNISVDNIVERLAPHKVPIVRLGHPARLLPSVLNHSLDILTQTSEAGEIVKDIRREMDSKQASIRKTKSGRERKMIYNEIRELRKEFREREKKCVGNLVGSAKVVLATLHGAGGFQARDESFDVVIIDEASQALEAQCWVPLLRAKKVVLAGDHLQLPPTIKSLNSKRKGKPSEKEKEKEEQGEDIIDGMTLETTLFDRLLQLYGSGVKRMLTTQYRMHSKIMQFPSDELYESKLIAADSVKARLLKDLEYEVQETEDTIEPLIFFDTQGGDFPEKSEEDEGAKKGKMMLGESKSNEMEAALVRRHVGNLVNAGVRAEDIAVITPYNAQLALMSRSMREAFPGIELGSVDGFQGREKEAIIVSLVRSNSDKEVGFLGERRRLNVAMTRPRRSLTIIGDSETFQNNKFLKRWMEFLEEQSDLRYPSVAELQAVQ